MMKPTSKMINLARSSKVNDYKDFNWKINEKETIKYLDIINFERAASKSDHHCVMCGNPKGPNCVIPNQNKDVCKVCDSSFWLLHALNVLIKFCKGCKKFSPLQDFDEKPEASKCAKCRKRGRQNYYSRKQDDDEVVVSISGNNRAKNDTKTRKINGQGKSKRETKSTASRYANAENEAILNKNSFNTLPKKNAMNVSGETDKSTSTLNTSSDSCPSPSSYQISDSTNKNIPRNSYRNPNQSFSSPSFNDNNSDYDMLGFAPTNTSGDNVKFPHPSRANERNGSRNSSRIATPSNRNGEVSCPDTNASVVSCSSQLSEGSGVYASNSHLWGDELREIEKRNSLGMNGRAESTNGRASSNGLTNNPMSCFRLPTGLPSTDKANKSGSGWVKGVGFPSSSRSSSRSSGVAYDRRDSRESSKSSSHSSKNTSVSSIGSAGGFHMNHFGDLGGVGINSEANTPGLLLSMTPRSSGLSFPQGCDIITPFGGTPVYSPFDSMNTPDSTWKWDPQVNPLMNLASLSTEVLSNTPPSDEKNGEDNSKESKGQAINAPVRKCNSDPGKILTSQATEQLSIKEEVDAGKQFIEKQATVKEEGTGNRTSDVSDEVSGESTQVQEESTINAPHDHIFRIALDSSQSLELSPPPRSGRKKRIRQQDDAISSSKNTPARVPVKKLRL